MGSTLWLTTRYLSTFLYMKRTSQGFSMENSPKDQPPLHLDGAIPIRVWERRRIFFGQVKSTVGIREQKMPLNSEEMSIAYA